MFIMRGKKKLLKIIQNEQSQPANLEMTLHHFLQMIWLAIWHNAPQQLQSVFFILIGPSGAMANNLCTNWKDNIKLEEADNKWFLRWSSRNSSRQRNLPSAVHHSQGAIQQLLRQIIFHNIICFRASMSSDMSEHLGEASITPENASFKSMGRFQKNEKEEKKRRGGWRTKWQCKIIMNLLQDCKCQ